MEDCLAECLRIVKDGGAYVKDFSKSYAENTRERKRWKKRLGTAQGIICALRDLEATLDAGQQPTAGQVGDVCAKLRERPCNPLPPRAQYREVHRVT